MNDRMEELKKIIVDAKKTIGDAIAEMEHEMKQLKASNRWRARRSGEYSFLDDAGSISWCTDYRDDIDNWRFKTNNYFKIKNETIAYKEYLIAKAVIIKDAGGYEFAHNSTGGYHGTYILESEKISWDYDDGLYCPDAIYFESKDSIKDSQDKHLKEWEIYIKYKLPKGKKQIKGE
jgi:hypothetical protein